ncbi:MAG: 4'-phosphopantetheinyl transferase superfamily protein [Crocinitomicaceae bacterium]
MDLHYQVHTIIATDEIIIKQLKYDEVAPETFDLSILSVEDRKKYEGFISDKRRREFYFARTLLRSFDVKVELFYRSTGKPLINEGHISISHSRNTIIVGYSKQHYIGVDIEYFNPKIFRIKNKFLAEPEKNNFDIEDQKILTLIWSIKEAIYKMEDIPGLLFREHICVTALNGEGEVNVFKNGLSHHYTFKYLTFDDFVITYCYLIS